MLVLELMRPREVPVRHTVSLTFIFLVACVLLAPFADAQAPTPAGVVVLAEQATLGSAKLTEGTTAYSGDLLRTETGGRIQIQIEKVQLTLAENSSARVFRNGHRIVVEVEKGTVAYVTSGNGEDLEFYALDIRLVPQTSKPSAGQVSVPSRCEVRATATRSTIEATSGKESKTIEETKSYSVTSEVAVDYHDSWVPVLSDYPDFAKDSDYHHSHGHAACPAAYNQARRPPLQALGPGHFREIVAGAVVLLTIGIVHEALESPDRP